MDSFTIDNKTAKKLAQKYNINLRVIPLKEWINGLNIELEHGKKYKLTNVTNNNLDMTAKITIAHLLENPHYYARLLQMESDAEIYWSTRNKPSIFLPQSGSSYYKYIKYKTKYQNLINKK